MKVVKFLLDRKVNPSSVVSQNGFTPIQIATEEGHENLIPILKSYL